MRKNIKSRPIDIALQEINRQRLHLLVSLIIPIILTVAVIITLFVVQDTIYPPILDENGKMISGGRWYYDIFTDAIIFLFIFAQIMAFKQFISFFLDFTKISKLLDTISKGVELDTLDSLKVLAQSIRDNVPQSDIRSLVLNWLDYRGDSTVKRNDILENNNFVRMDLKKDKSTYFHVLMNRITLKMGFLGTLLGLMMTFPKMKNAILSLKGGNGDMSFVTDIAAAIDGDQYAILTTLIATILSLFAEFLTLQLINRFSLNYEYVLSYLADWYHTRVEPLYEHGTTDVLERMEKQFSSAEEMLAQNMQVITTLTKKNAEQLAKLAEFNNVIDKRVKELEAYEVHYRELMNHKTEAEEHIVGNVAVLTEVADKTGEQLKKLVSAQEIIGARVENLHHYEEQYRSLISTKDTASVPQSLRPKGE